MIEVEGITKRYGNFVAVDNVSFVAQTGRVTGFLGPNGAGKSTSLRILVGLTPPDAGSAHFQGFTYAEIPNPGRNIGVLLDASSKHAGRTGLACLKRDANILGVSEKRIGEVLELVGLTAVEAKRRTGDYSLGMRQRLGIASALLGDPKVLILDEPANGLDPQGIHWMRGLLRDFAHQGGAVLLSSHLLHEVEQIADDLILIGNGRIAAAGSKDDLLSGAAITIVSAEDAPALGEALVRAGLLFQQLEAGAFEVQAEPADVGRVAAHQQIVLTELSKRTNNLEKLFFDITADASRDGNVTAGAA